MHLSFRCLAFGGLGWLAGCIEPYEPPREARDANLLVVDGFINSAGVTSVRLSRTQSLSAKGSAPAEKQARVFVEEENGARYPLREGVAGTYTSGALLLPAGRLVRLRLTTAQGREYASGYTRVLHTPPVDSISSVIGADKRLRLLVNAHDDANEIHHYRWSYEETWEFKSRYRSYREFRNGRLSYRSEDIQHCWGSEKPSAIKLGSSLHRSPNAASEPLTVLLDTSPKLSSKYSLLVRQYALTPEEYAYWVELRRNTEQLGTVFSPMPSQLTGNVHSLSDPAEKVLGFVGAQSVTEKRIFIDRNDLPPSWPLVTGYENCELYENGTLNLFVDGRYTPVDEGPPGGIYYGTTDCIDCRTRGTNVRPDFWP
ncbi:DUF4249 domain-containing protein [Hymenobacter edaphi]|nr:DUF4249 domain-containing protein [Hymenobacter edaphi]